MSDAKPSWTPELLESPHDAPDKADRVRAMFNEIAPRYELVNRVFSAGRDSKWRRRVVQLADIHDRDEVLDVACGTGNLARAFASACPRIVVGVDFAHEMLVRAVNPFGTSSGRALMSPAPVEQGSTSLGWCEGDALRLPFPDGSFTVVCCAFGVRNFSDLNAGLREMYRVLKPGGRVVILEFTRPRGRLARRLYEFYANKLMPVGAALVSGDKSGAYRYLPKSVVSFVEPEELVGRLGEVGFVAPSMTPLTMGVVTIYLAKHQ